MAETVNALRTRNLDLPPLATAGTLRVPDEPRGIVLFAHGSGSSRFSRRISRIASALQEAGLATFLFDLVAADEAADRAKLFDIPLLAERLLLATELVRQDNEARHLSVGYFGTGTGAAAALAAAARAPFAVAAVVSGGGRPDLAGSALARVQAPTLLVVGGRDCEVLTLNEIALARMRCEKDLKVIPGARHHFYELGTLDRITAFASSWFREHLSAVAPPDAAALRGPQRLWAATGEPAIASLG
jgi:predicted alpha/beta-hydrolase family hydrolase